jgi:HD-GYP domain-containing protein (c-di-GMP phosphodiesterase class II)
MASVMYPKLEKVPTSNLQPGYYVERLDRPWIETPFMFQGFFISDQDEIKQLQQYCEYVFVDRWRSQEESARSTAARQHTTQPGTGNASGTWGATPVKTALDQAEVPRATSTSGGRKRAVYPSTVPVEREIAAAEITHNAAGHAVKSFITKLQQDGNLDLDLVKQTVEPMMESVLRNPDAMVWLSRMQQHDSYSYHHSVNCTIWGLAFARHLGLDKQAIYEIGLGCMLFDVGKTRLSNALLTKPEALSPHEVQAVHHHVEYSLAILEKTGGLTSRIMDMVRSHHERFDGSGYPHGLKGNDIPTFAKIAGMVDCYDALVSPRPYAKRLSAYDAIRETYFWRGKLFQSEVVEQFMQVVGVFPTGALVELNTGAVAVVIAQNEERRLRPRIMLLLDERKRRLPHFEIVDLLHDRPWEDAKRFWIDKHLQPGSYGIDPEKLYL